MALANRTFCALMVLAPVAVMTARPAAAAEPEPGAAELLPFGIHHLRSGRYSQDVCDHHKKFFCTAQRLLPLDYHPGDAIVKPQAGGGGSTSAPSGEMSPTDVQAAYGLTGVPAAGGIVAIEDLPDSTALADLNVYRQAYGMSPMAQCSGMPTGNGTPCFAVADENGNLNPSGLSDGGSADTETSLDMDMISAACPTCSIVLIEFTGQGPTDSDFSTAAAAAANLGANAVSISWGGGEGGGGSTGYTIPGQMLVLAASGDQGYEGEETSGGGGGGGFGGGGNNLSPNYPASSPTVMAVGGTNLAAGGGTSYSETVWADMSGATGSGCSTSFTMPSYQTAFGTSKFGTCTGRASNDVAAAAEFTASGGTGGGIAQYCSSQGGFQAVVGTSAATPLVAAIFTRLGLTGTIASNFGYVYDNIANFNDVTSGNNDPSNVCTNKVMCNAGVGWDGPTGVGTPNGAKLLGTNPSGSSSGGTSSSSGAGGSSSGAGGSGSSSGGVGSSSGAGGSGSSSGGGSDDGGLVYVSDDSGVPTLGQDAGALGASSSGGAGSGNGFGPGGGSGGSSSSGCGCTVPGTGSSPAGETGAMLLAVGGLVVAGSRSRKRR